MRRYAAGHEFRRADGTLICTLKTAPQEGDIVRIEDYEWPGDPPKSGEEIEPELARAIFGKVGEKPE